MRWEAFRASAFLAAVLPLASLACGTIGAAPDPGASASTSGSLPKQHVEWVQIPIGMDGAAFVKNELARAAGDKKKLIVYVGATWCQPCQHFHKAAEAGELDSTFPDL